MTMFIRAVKTDNKATAIKRAISEEGGDTFFPDLENFKELPGTPFAYWIGEGVREVFKRFPTVEGDGRVVRVGLQTSDDFRFLRAQWEVNSKKRGEKWFPFAKGGQLSPFYAPLHLVIHWDETGKEMKAWADPLYGNSGWSRIIKSTELYFRPGMTWPLRASRFAPQPLPAGCIFSVRGYSVFLPEADLLPGLAVFNSKPFDYFFKAMLGRFGYPEFVVGVLQKLPWAEPNAEQAKALAILARKAWSTARTADTAVETSLAFTLPRPLNPGAQIATAPVLTDLQSRIDAIACEVFGLDGTDRNEIEDASIFATAEINVDVDEGEDGDIGEIDAINDHLSLLSWCVGVAFGRFDIRLATGERTIPPEPEPFDPLPATSPGMLPEGDAPFMSCSTALVDDPGHSDDLTKRVTMVYEHIGERAPEPESLRRSLAKNFFPAHLKIYSKSRRKAPIYWQLSVPSGSYSVWLYAHRLDRDTFIQIQNDFVAPKLAHEERQLTSLIQSAGVTPNSKESMKIEAQEAFVGEMRELLDEVKRVAPLWHPSLDDGVVLTMAPHWRLVPQHKPWQKELKSKWDDLVAGKYDWAHLAMHLWPERVVPKCAEDRSLAIAHDLEDALWFEDDDGKWKPIKKPQKSVDDLVSERTSAAVKAALKSLLDAPESAAGTKRSRKSKAA